MVRDVFRTHGRILRENGRRPGVVNRQLRQGAAGEQVDAAVSHRADRGVLTGDEQADDRGAHPAVIVAAFRGAKDLAVGQVDRGPQAVPIERQRVVDAVWPGDVVVLVGPADEAADRVDRQLRGHFPGFVTAHAVGDREKTQVCVGNELVFIALSDTTGVRHPECSNHDARLQWSIRRRWHSPARFPGF
jgi:hypothetical protein